MIAPFGILAYLRGGRRPMGGESRPLGAIAPPALLGGGDLVIGEVVGGDPAPAPVSGRACVAYGVGLHHQAARPSTLVAQESICRSFKVRTDGGDLVDVPGGALVLDGNRDPIDPDPERVRDYLARLSLLGERGERLLEFDEVREIRIQLGDRVAVYGDLRRELDPAGEPATYREPPAPRFVPIGTPKVERLGGGKPHRPPR